MTGLVIGAQAFQTTPRIQTAGVVPALIPNIASWAQGEIDNALQAAGGLVAGRSGTGHVELSDLISNGVIYDGLVKAGGGAVLAGLVLGAIAVFVIEREFTSSSPRSACSSRSCPRRCAARKRRQRWRRWRMAARQMTIHDDDPQSAGGPLPAPTPTSAARPTTPSGRPFVTAVSLDGRYFPRPVRQALSGQR
jgi:hypothetical protein